MLVAHVVARLEVVHHLGRDLAVGDHDAVDAQHHQGRQQLLAAGGDLGARGGHQQRLHQLVVEPGDGLVQRQRAVDAGDRRTFVRLRADHHARSGRRAAAEGVVAAFAAETAHVEGAAAHAELEDVRELFDQVVAALVLGGVVVAELVQALGDVGDQFGVGLHLLDR